MHMIIEAQADQNLSFSFELFFAIESDSCISSWDELFPDNGFCPKLFFMFAGWNTWIKKPFFAIEPLVFL